MATNEEMISGVRKHALDNYTKGGWDYLVECWDDSDIIEAIKGYGDEKACTTTAQLISRVGEAVGAREEQRFEAQALSGELEHFGIEEGPDGKLRRKETS